jgi:SOS-response transcriptional repressor LexA
VFQALITITKVKTIGERIKFAREKRGMTQTQLAREVGVSQGTVGNLESGLRERPREILGLAKALAVSATWLETGAGEWERKNDGTPAAGRRRIPLISWAQADALGETGGPFHPEDVSEWVDTYTSPSEGAFGLRVAGEVMTNPSLGQITFPEGTIITVDPNIQASAGEFVVAKDAVTHKATFKQLVYDGGRWFLKPLNPSYPTVEIDDVAGRVVGKVTELQLRRRL